MNPEKTLLLVDGSSYLYRAFHALPELRNSKGEPTGAIYGVLNMLRKLAADYKAGARACVFDAKGKTFRDEHYPEYKANRAPMPDDLAAQVQPLCEAIEALGWPVLVIDGVEADDVIATLAEQAKREGWRAVISTGDKDFAQLVEERVTLVNTMSNEKLDIEGVKQKFGVPPEKFLDYLTLIGDAIDNIPGVDKVGPKTACKWIEKYGSLEGVLAHAAEIPGLAGENLRKMADWLPKARELLTIKRDVPLPLTIEQLTQGRPDPTRQRAQYERFGFKTWLKEVENAPATAVPAEPRTGPRKRRHRMILSEDELKDLLLKMEAVPLVGFDTACAGEEPMTARLVGLSFAFADEAVYLPLAHEYPAAPSQVDLQTAIELLQPWLEREDCRKVGENVKFDSHVLANHGVRLGGCIHDTLLESYVLEVHERHDLGTLAQRHCGWTTLRLDEVTGKGAGRIAFSAIDVARATEFAAEQTDCALALHEILYPRIADDEKLKFIYESIEMPLVPVLFRMERNGVLLDSAKLEAQSHELGKEIFQKEQQAYALAGQPFNLGSPKQIREILFDRQKLPVKKKTPTGEPSTDEDSLAELALDHPLPRLILEHRALSKLKSTYTDKLPKSVHPRTGRVHTTYSQTTAVTGRLSSNDPNLQNIPIRTPAGRRIRECFIAPPGARIVSADYSQIELRIMAHLSGDESLRRAFRAGEDVHRATAAEVFGLPLEKVTSDERRVAKVINFGLIYGMSSFGVAQNLGIDRSTAQTYVETYFARYPGVKRYMDETREKARAQGYVQTVFGRRLWLPELKSGAPIRRQAAERAAINAPMQGTAADLIKLAMIAVQRSIEKDHLKSLLIMQVHDELVLQVPEPELKIVKSRVSELMQSVASLDVPLVVDIGVGMNWDEAH
ncbi:MAG: DNA polymerase I [Betaproteobacteria bacterium RIFCSPLOWO2_12_FULL_65_14]|nr:MAG: DNA polymerase I [Betaproteobacteria bacterium RIFCSPLOWO2_12_FULL_65_14]